MAFRYFKCGDRILSQVCSAGLPNSYFFSALMSISTIILNQILVAYGNAPVAAIELYLRQICLSHFYRWDWQMEYNRY